MKIMMIIIEQIATRKQQVNLEYKTKITWKTPDYNNRLTMEVVVPLKYFRNFWKLRCT